MAPRRKRGVNKATPKEELRLGDLVLAKVKGFPAWPAKIGQPQDWDYAPDPKKHFVQFFGTQEIAFVTPPDIQAFTSEAKTKLVARCQGKTVKYFAQAVEEISAAFEELQNHKSDISGNEALLNAVERSLTKPKVLDQTHHREASNDEKFDKFDSGADPCLGGLVENNGVETKPDIVEKDSSPFLKSINRTTSASREPLEHESPDLIIKVAGFDDKINGVTSTERRDGAGKNNSQRIIKKITGDLDRRCKNEVHRTDNHLHGRNQKLKGSGKECFDSKLVSDLNITSSKKQKELLKDNPSAQGSDDKHKYALGCKSGILGKTKRIQSELKKSASGADESKRASKRPWSKDANGQQQRKSKSLLPVGEGKAEESDIIGDVSIPKRENVTGISARRGKIGFDKEGVAYAKRHKQTVEHTSVISFYGCRDKEGTNHPKRKISSASDIDVTVPTAQLPKRRRAVYISDEDNDEDPKTPVHGGHTIVPKANLAATDGPKSANVSRDTSTYTYKAKLLAEYAKSAQLPKRRKTVCIYDEVDDDDPKTPVHGKHTDVPKANLASADGPINANPSHDTSFDTFVKALLAGSAESVGKRKVPLYKHNKDVSRALPDSMEGYRSPMGKPVKELPPKYVKPILRSPKNSHQLVSFTKQVTGKNEKADVCGVGMANSVEVPLNSSSMGKPVIKAPAKHVKQILRSPKKLPMLSSSKEQVAGQNKFAKLSGAGIPQKCKGNSSEDGVAGSDSVSSSPSQTANQKIKPAFGEKGTPKVATRLNDAGVPRDISVNLAAGIVDVNQENGSAPSINSRMPDFLSMKDLTAAAQAEREEAHSHTPSSACIAMLIVAQGHQQDLTVSNHAHQFSLNNQTEPEEKEGRSVSSGNWSVGGSESGDTEAAISRDAFEGMLETLSRTKESIGRATRQAIVCAKYGIASEVVEVLIRKLEIEPHFPRKVDLFFLVDSITQRSHNQKGKAGALYIPTVQAALPRLLSAAAPPGTGARENRHQCRKVLRLWLERRIFPDSLLRRYIGDISGSGGDSTVGFSLRRPSRSERAVDDPIRDMEEMLIDEYGSNASFQLPGFLSSHTFGYDKEDEDLPRTSQEVTNTHMEEPVHALDKLKAHDSSSKNPQGFLEDVNGVLEMGVVSCQLRDNVLPYAREIEAKEDSLAATTATEVTPFLEGSPPAPHDSPPSPPPLPPSSPPQPPSSRPKLPLSSPSVQCSSSLPAPWAPLPPLPSIARPLLSITQASMPSNPSLPLRPGFDPPACQYHKPMLQDHSSIATSKQIDQVLENAAHGQHANGDFICKNRFLSATSKKTTPRDNELSTCC